MSQVKENAELNPEFHRIPTGYPRATHRLPKGYPPATQGGNTRATPEQPRSNALEPPPTQGILTGLAGVQYPLPYFNGSFTVKVLPTPT